MLLLQVVIITGCNTGLGRESARVLAARGAGERAATAATAAINMGVVVRAV